MDEQEFKVAGAYISGDERERILGSEVISLQDAKVILSSNHSFSVSDAHQFINTKFPESAVRNLDIPLQHIYYDLCDFCLMYPPDTVCFDPDDPTTWGPFKADSFRFPKKDICYSICGRSEDGHPVFELYSITINKLAPKRDFALIYMESDATGQDPFIIYKHPKGKHLEYDKPLPLRIPLLPPTLLQCVVISFTKNYTHTERWSFAYSALGNCNDCRCKGNCECYPVDTENCNADRSTSMATILYRIIKFAGWAELTFRIFEEEDRDIYVIYGAIIATDSEDCRTKRIIREYPKEEGPVCLPSGEDLEMYRYVFGVPKDSYLRVEVELTYFVKGFPNEEKKIQGCLDFTVAPSYWVDLLGLHTPHASLFVQTVWTTPYTRLWC